MRAPVFTETTSRTERMSACQAQKQKMAGKMSKFICMLKDFLLLIYLSTAAVEQA